MTFRLRDGREPWYDADMFRWVKRRRTLAKAAAGLRLLFALFLFTVTGLQGLSLCFCQPDPDACGEHCHNCGESPDRQTEQVDHVCDHLMVAELPPGENVPTGLDELAAVLALRLLAERVPFEPAASPRLSLSERPPDVLHPHLRFITRSTQILC